MPTFDLKDAEVASISRMFSALDNVEHTFEAENDKLEPTSPELAAAGAKLFAGFKCTQCHVASSANAMREAAELAPDLSLARSRLRPLWIEKLLRDPEALMPGTSMPGYFPDMQSPEKSILGGDPALQIRALRDYILGLGHKGKAP
jgi:hypothetical protein